MRILKQLHRVQSIEITVNFIAFGRRAFSVATVNMDDLNNPAYVMQEIDKSIEKFMEENNPAKVLPQ